MAFDGERIWREKPVRALMGSTVLLIGLGCRPGINYADPASPRYAEGAKVINDVGGHDTLRIVSFNIEYARQVRRATHVLKTATALRDADVILLQEMTAPATKLLADSLRMGYVYYPAIYNRIMRRDIGNAILSRWPITEDSKLVLPKRSRYAGTQRIATAATIRVRGEQIRVYSTHFGTPADLGWKGRVEQLRAILDDAASYRLVVIGGDMNSKDIGRIAREAGYLWPTDTIPRSNEFGRLDHFFVRGLVLPRVTGVGTYRVQRSVSDHHPIWIRLFNDAAHRITSVNNPDDRYRDAGEVACRLRSACATCGVRPAQKSEGNLSASLSWRSCVSISCQALVEACQHFPDILDLSLKPRADSCVHEVEGANHQKVVLGFRR